MSDVKRLRELEAENAKLKRMYADLALENAAIKDVLEPKAVTPSAKRQVARGAGAGASPAGAASLSGGEALAGGVLPASDAGEPAGCAR